MDHRQLFDDRTERQRGEEGQAADDQDDADQQADEQPAMGREGAGRGRQRLLGRELCLLAWAVETASPEVIPSAVRSWVALRPDERWWLFSMAAATTGDAVDADVGWRKAIRIALTENPSGEEQAPARAKRVKAKVERPSLLPLFEER